MLIKLFIISIISFIFFISGSLLLFYNPKFANKHIGKLISFSAGVLLGVAFFDILPQAVTMGGVKFALPLKATLLGFTLLYLLEHFIMMHSCVEQECSYHTLGITGLIGFYFHTFTDGLILSLGFAISEHLGMVTALAILLHKVPGGISSMSIFLAAKLSNIRAWRWSLVVSSGTVLGALVGYFIFSYLDFFMLKIMLGLSAGSFIYISASSLLPEVHKEMNFVNILMFILGIMIVDFAGVI